jgi:DNA polymerase-3 subunit epsilon
MCPCADQVTEHEYWAVVDRLVHALTVDPAPLLTPLEARMRSLAEAERFEEAADVRERASALSSAIRRQRRLDGLRRAGRIVVELAGGGGVELDGGLLVRSWSGHQPPLTLETVSAIDDGPVPRHLADEVAVVSSWLEREAARLRLVSCSDELTSPAGRVPRFEPRGGDNAERTATKVLVSSVRGGDRP